MAQDGGRGTANGGRMTSWRLVAALFMFAVFAAFSSSAAAQYRSQAAVGVSSVQHDLSRPTTSSLPLVSVDTTHHRMWPWLALGGGILAGGTVWALTVNNCDSGCQDDGGRALGFRSAVFATVVGTFVGALVGILIDDSRGASP